MRSRPRPRSLTRPAGLLAVALVCAGLTVTASLVAVARDAGDDAVAIQPPIPVTTGAPSPRATPAEVPTAAAEPGEVSPTTVARLASVKGKVTWRSGAFSGGTLQENLDFAAWRGRPLDTVLFFAPQENWRALQNPDFIASEVRKAPSIRPVISYAMFPVTESGGLPASASPTAVGARVLPLGAAGRFDEQWRTVASNLVSAGMPDAIIRPGWEFNGSWYRWSARSDATAEAFAAYFRRIVTAMRSVPGARFSFTWAPVQLNGGTDLVKAYPGDAFVDDIGFDVYNSLFKRGATAEEQWNLLRTIKYGLDWQLAFATQHGKPISYPEWGAFASASAPRIAGGDDTLFIRNMFAWMVQHPPAYENYFDFDTEYGSHYGLYTSTTLMPRSAEAYRVLWGR